MKRFFIVILSIIFLCENINAEEITFVYTEWFDYYPIGVNSIRIESKDMYRWFKIEDDNRIETEEYYDELEGYEKIEESKKTFYRVINNDYILINRYGQIVRDTNECIKALCTRRKMEKYIPHKEEEPNEEEPTINPNTFDPIYLYYFSLMVCILILVLLNHRKINLVMSNRWK